MKTLSINATKRTEYGKKVAKAIRREGQIPCIIYGGGEEIAFSVDAKEVKPLIYTPNSYVVEINIDGKDVGALIGHHGETLDSLQYLVNLAANQKTEGEKREFVKITIDIEGYRAKREEALRALARRMAAKVVKGKKSVMLEPMNPYERRIIHSEVQGIKGVSTNSIGSENNRRVVMFLDDSKDED
jgi:spoIIIJ-associated protein